MDLNQEAIKAPDFTSVFFAVSGFDQDTILLGPVRLPIPPIHPYIWNFEKFC